MLISVNHIRGREGPHSCPMPAAWAKLQEIGVSEPHENAKDKGPRSVTERLVAACITLVMLAVLSVVGVVQFVDDERAREFRAWPTGS